MGVIFLSYGIGKFVSGVGSFVGTMNQQFSVAGGFESLFAGVNL